MKINIPNQITLIRLALAIAFFVLLALFRATELPSEQWVLKLCFWLFVVAAATDWVDGLLARMLKQVTVFGRVADPIVDKVLVCGAFIYFASDIFYVPARGNVTFVAPWMATLIVARELLVSALRAQVESAGQDFSAVWIGKLKMLVQSVAIGIILGYLAWFEELRIVARLAVWAAVAITIVSMVSYIRRAVAFASQPTSPETAERTSPPSADEASAEDRHP